MTQATITWALGLLVTGVPALYGAGTWADGRYNHQDEFVQEISELRQELNATNDRIEYRQLNDMVRQKDSTLQQIENRNKGADRSQWAEADRERVNELELEKKQLERKLAVYEQRVLKSNP